MAAQGYELYSNNSLYLSINNLVGFWELLMTCTCGKEKLFVVILISFL